MRRAQAYLSLLFDMARSENIQVRFLRTAADGEEEWDGLYICSKEQGCRIAINERLNLRWQAWILAHELGHHACRHLVEPGTKTHHEIEEEADRFMGFAMKRLGTPLDALVETYIRLGIDAESPSHPALEARMAAIASGYSAETLGEVCPEIETKGTK